MGYYIVRYPGAFAGLQVNHYIIKPTVAANFTGGFVGDAELHPAASVVNGFNTRLYYKMIAHYQGAFVGYMGGTHYPAKAALYKFFHGHAVAAFHLVVPGG